MPDFISHLLRRLPAPVLLMTGRQIRSSTTGHISCLRHKLPSVDALGDVVPRGRVVQN